MVIGELSSVVVLDSFLACGCGIPRLLPACEFQLLMVFFGVFTRVLFGCIYAEVVTFVAGSLEAGGLPGYTEVLISLK